MTALQSLALLSALPFSIVMIGMCVSLWRSLSTEVRVIERLELRIRQREFIERYSGEIADQVEAQVSSEMDEQFESRFEGDFGQQFQAQLNQQVHEQVHEQVVEHLQTYTGEMQLPPQDGAGEAPEGGTARGRRSRKNPFTRGS